MRKFDLRKQMKVELAKIQQNQKYDYSKAACKLAIDFMNKNDFDILLCYVDTQTEISPQLVTEYFMNQKKIVALPRVIPNSQNMDFYILDNEVNLDSQLEITNKFNIREPISNQENLFDATNFINKNICVIIPGVAFGYKGERLGHGMGFYDIYLSRLRKICPHNKLFLMGFCYSFQKVNFVPTDSNDFLMNALCTEKELIIF